MRTLVLFDTDTEPPVGQDYARQLESSDEAEFDVARALREKGHEVRLFGVRDDLDALVAGLRAEPTLNLGHRTDLVAGLGLGWERCIANELTSHDATHLRSYNRAVVFVDYEALVGLRTEPVRDWLSVGLSLSVALPTMQTGTLWDSTQAFTADGHRIMLDGLPSVSHRFMGLFELGLIL